MNSVETTDLISTILKPCFPRGENFKILNNYAANGNVNYTSQIIPLSIEYYENEKLEFKHIVVKIPNAEGRLHQLFKSYDFFDREIFVYDCVLPRINQFLDEPLVPFHYGTIDSKILILENCATSGHKSEVAGQLFDLEQCRLILRALANFHAASFKLGQTEPHILDENIFQCSPIIEWKEGFIDTWQPMVVESLRKKGEFRLIPKVEKVLEYVRNESATSSKLHPSNFKFHTLNHGDFRKDNLLLKYDSNGRPTSVKILDFQTCLLTTPVQDFIFFFTNSVTAAVTDQHFEELINVYLQCLNERLEKLNCRYIYEKAAFMADLKKLSFFTIVGVVASLTTLCLLNYDQHSQTILPGMKRDTHFHREFLHDQAIVDTLWTRLKFCENTGAFDAVLDEPQHIS